MASGALNPAVALGTGAVLLIGSLAASYFIHPLLTAVLAVYFMLNVAYSFKLKHVVILDIMTIAAGFVLRAIAGGLAIHVNLTPWFLLCTMLLSLFLAIGKRRHELFLLADQRDAPQGARQLFLRAAGSADQHRGYGDRHQLFAVHVYRRTDDAFDVDDSFCHIWHLPLLIFDPCREEGRSARSAAV